MFDEIARKLKLASTKVKPYQGFILLCGGLVEESLQGPLVSIRDTIHRELSVDRKLTDRIRLAESYKDWSEDATYRDLVVFESHLAELSSVIVLVLESPGSLAELGLFTAIPQFTKKLLVFIETDHYRGDSFIKHGPINYLEKTHQNSAECHRWAAAHSQRQSFNPDLAHELRQELADAVRQRAEQVSPARQFDPEQWFDRALLVCDLLDLCSALSLREILSMMKRLQVNSTEAELNQMLYLLERLDLLERSPGGGQRFYVRTGDHQFLHLRTTDQANDIVRMRSSLLKNYSQNDKKRFRAIQAIRRHQYAA